VGYRIVVGVTTRERNRKVDVLAAEMGNGALEALDEMPTSEILGCRSLCGAVGGKLCLVGGFREPRPRCT
jgi:hypothetical protein